MNGEGAGGYAYGMWPVVVFNILLFLLFIISFIRPKTKEDWAPMGPFIAFIVALFTEMYGFPLTTYLLTALLGEAYPVLDPFSHPSGHLVLVFLGLAHSPTALLVLHLISNIIILAGFYLIFKGWRPVYRAKGERLVKEGIYARVRHPQYDGIFLITVGFLIQWPSPITLIMWPILTYAYYRLALKKERNMEQKFGKVVLEYNS